jgi:hypothetical protein
VKYFFPESIVITDSDIGIYENADGTINSPWLKSEKINGYGAIRQYNNKRYMSLRKIEDLVTYIWQDSDPLNKYAIKTSDDSTSNGTAIPIVNGVTTVYVVSNEKYYKAKTTGTVDFTSESYLTPANFNEVTDGSLRYKYFNPENRDESSLYWEYKGVSNYSASTSKAINRYSTKNADSFYQEFIVKGANICVLYNVVATTVTVDIRNNVTNELLQPIYEVDATSRNYTSVREFLDSSQEPTNYKRKIILRPNFYNLGEMKVRFTFENTLENPRIGEILIGRIADGGITLDGVENPTESDIEIIKNEAGEYEIDGEGDETRVWRSMRLNIKIPTPTYNIYSQATKKIISNKMVILGENTEDGIYESLILFGIATNASPTLVSNSTLSDLNINFREINSGEN